MTDPEFEVCDAAGKALVRIGPSALPSITQALRDGGPEARLIAVRVLRQTGSGWKPPLRDNFNEVAHYRFRTGLDGQSWGQATTEIDEAIRAAVKDSDPAIRLEAIACSVERGLARAEEIRELWQSNDPANVDLALLAVSGLDKAAVQFLPELMKLFDDKTLLSRATGIAASDPHRLEYMLLALKAMKTGAQPAIPRLIAIADDRRDRICLMIAETLDASGADDEQILSVLRPLMWTRSYGEEAGQWLVEHRPDEARRLVSVLTRRLGSGESGADEAMLNALGSLGALAHEAVPAIVPFLRQPDKWLAVRAAHALGSIGTGAEAALHELELIVGNPKDPFSLRCACANALGGVGPAAHRSLPTLQKVMERPEPSGPVIIGAVNESEWSEWDLRAAIIRTIGQIGAEHAALISILRSQLTSRSSDLRAASAEQLGACGATSAEVLSDLIRLLRDEDTFVQARTAVTISRLKGDRGAAVEPLASLLINDNLYVRAAAAIALGKSGAAARPGLPALRKALSDSANSRSLNVSQPSSNRRAYLKPGDGVESGTTVAQAVQSAINEIENDSQLLE
ncbi:MAG: HEAT repeat domain-containing protein [Planctomycetia bacterium]|nr:HEAT repeat domain-containing protein [Planctomycetia bacterium]